MTGDDSDDDSNGVVDEQDGIKKLRKKSNNKYKILVFILN
jgi:hypothetical protein